MSGICGIFSLEGDHSIAANIKVIADRLERRGPDGTHLWHKGPIALGHTLLATTPEALIEVLPLTDRNSGCTITADARLDNRDELIAALDLAGKTRTIGDGELILLAYLRWGEDCPKHLLGDFAFAIWDARSARLFCARDHMGMRQLIYHHMAGKLFAFATEADALVAHARVPKRINEARIADFLDDLEGIDFTSTFFEEVFRLPPAHTLVVSDQGLTLRRYWELTPAPELKLDSDEAYTAAFLDVFTEAVRCRLRSAGPVGSMLSGGIDSNAVAAVAAKLVGELAKGPLKTFSVIASDLKGCAETQAILASIGHGSFSSTLIDHAKLDVLWPDLIQLIQENREPFDGQMSLIRAVYLHARSEGAKIVLDGMSADIVLTSGNGVARFLRKGNVGRAWREAKGRERFWGGSEKAQRIILDAAWVIFVPSSIRSLRQRSIAMWSDLKLYRGRQLVAKGFAQSTGLRSRRAVYHRLSGTGATIVASDRANLIGRPWFVAGRERYDRVASAVAIEPRDPFLDIRVIAFCLALPPEQLECDGWPKVILRRAMAGRVTDRVIWRRGKEHLGLTFTNTLIDRWDGWRAVMRNQMSMIRRFINPKTLPLTQTISTMDILSRYRLIMLALWLEGPSAKLDVSRREV